jgi:hypothetical protein
MKTLDEMHRAYGCTSYDCLDMLHLTGKGSMDRLSIALQNGKKLVFRKGGNYKQGLRDSYILETGQTCPVEILVTKVEAYFYYMSLGIRFERSRRPPGGYGSSSGGPDPGGNV